LWYLNEANHIGEACAARKTFISHLFRIVPLPFPSFWPANNLVFFSDTYLYRCALEGFFLILFRIQHWMLGACSRRLSELSARQAEPVHGVGRLDVSDLCISRVTFLFSLSFSFMPKRQRYLFVCINRRPDDNPKGCCAAKASEDVYKALKAEVAARGLAKIEARVCTSSCLDECATGVTILVEPDHFFYGHVTVGDVPEIVHGLAIGQRVERLLLTSQNLLKDQESPSHIEKGIFL
jgi:(2Fe-2S) ferredoxin